MNSLEWQARFASYRRRVCERFGIARYSRPARDDLDRKLAAYLPRRGMFVEAGAHDGYSESNTYYLERIRGWRGVLVEPVPGNYDACRRNRPGSRVFNCALVSRSFGHDHVTVNFADRMTWTDGALNAGEEQLSRANLAPKFSLEKITVPARTLDSILLEAGVGKIDFFSLDVEGYELDVLDGFDLERFKPTFLLVECRGSERLGAMRARLEHQYRFAGLLTRHDALFQWSGR